MEQYELRAYEVMGYWTIVLIRVQVDEDGVPRRSMVYSGDHVPIDETEPMLRAAMLLSQVEMDLSWSLAQLASVPDQD